MNHMTSARVTKNTRDAPRDELERGRAIQLGREPILDRNAVDPGDGGELHISPEAVLDQPWGAETAKSLQCQRLPVAKRTSSAWWQEAPLGLRCSGWGVYKLGEVEVRAWAPSRLAVGGDRASGRGKGRRDGPS